MVALKVVESVSMTVAQRVGRSVGKKAASKVDM